MYKNTIRSIIELFYNIIMEITFGLVALKVIMLYFNGKINYFTDNLMVLF